MNALASPPTVAVIGLGTIGGTIARLLLEEAATVTVYDIRPEVAAEFASAGAHLAASCGEAAANADYVAIAVFNDAQALDVLTSRQGILSTARPGTTVLLHSTVRLDTVHRMHAAAAAKGVVLLDAGVSTAGGDGTGRLAVFVGGDAADLEGALPVLGRYSRMIEHLGPSGSGMTAKLVRNLLAYSFMAATYEALALAETAGVRLEKFRQVISESDVFDQARLIMGVPTTRPMAFSDTARKHVERLLGLSGDDAVRFVEQAASTMEKDMDDITALAKAAGFPLRLNRSTRALIRPFLLLEET